MQKNTRSTTQADSTLDPHWSTYVVQPTLTLDLKDKDLAQRKLEEYAQQRTIETQVSTTSAPDPVHEEQKTTE